MVTAITGLLSNTFLFRFSFYQDSLTLQMAVRMSVCGYKHQFLQMYTNIYKLIFVIAIIATQELFTHTQSLEETCSSNSKLHYYETSF